MKRRIDELKRRLAKRKYRKKGLIMETDFENDEYHDVMKDIKGIATEINQLAKQAGNVFAKEVTIILKTQNNDCQRIEQLLDRMLDFCFDAEVLIWFRKLCRYYYGIDPEATAHYISFYRKIWDSENDDDGSELSFPCSTVFNEF